MSWGRTFRELGPATFASYLAARAAERVPGLAWHRYRLIAVPVAGMPEMPRGHEVVELDESGIGGLSAELELPAQAIDHRLGQGMTCLAVRRNGLVLGVNWVTARAFVEDEVPVRFVPPPTGAWDTGLYVGPAERGGRAFAALWAGTASWLRARGLAWSYSRIVDYNLASWRSHLRMQGRPVGGVAVLRVGRHDLALGSSPFVRLSEGEPVQVNLKVPG
jgi:hypothetical protein